MSDYTDIGAESEIGPGERKLTVVDGTPIGVFNVDGEYYAVENECAHQHGPVCTGKVQRELKVELTEPGAFDREWFGEAPTIACPWHGWEYDLRTGDHLGDSDHGIAAFDVRVEDGRVYVSLD